MKVDSHQMFNPALGVEELLKAIRQPSKRINPHNTREDRIPSKTRAKHYKRSKVGPSRIVRASGMNSQAQLDAAVSARLRGDLTTAERLAREMLEANPYCPRAKKELNRIMRLVPKQEVFL